VTAFANLEPIEREPTSSIIASAIRDRIMDGAFPPGMQLGEAQLARSLGVSRGPVREAMQRLIQEGLLHNERHRGVFVTTLDEGDVADIYLARSAIERVAAAALVASGDPAAFAELQSLVDQMDAALGESSWSRLMDLDLAFHQRMVERSGSKRLIRMYQSLVVETRMSLARLEPAYPRYSAIVAEHRVLLEALASGDAARAMACVDEHLDHAVSSLQAQTS
jgi:DNA-binding GntR family transcriptional regulator